MSAGRRLLAVADALPVTVLAVIAGAGSFTHIRDTAAQHGQGGPMSWAVAVCVDLTCVMAARERQRDKQAGIPARRLSWPAVVLAGGNLPGCLTPGIGRRPWSAEGRPAAGAVVPAREYCPAGGVARLDRHREGVATYRGRRRRPRAGRTAAIARLPGRRRDCRHRGPPAGFRGAGTVSGNGSVGIGLIWPFCG